jgi:hypothetical protein
MPAQAVFGPQGELLTVYPRDVTSEERLRIIQAAETYLGVPYEWGGSSREGIDCSHLVSVSIKEAGIPYSYSTTGTMSQNTSLRSIAQSEAGIGDVILFVGHTGIYNPDTPVAGKPVISAQTKLPAAVSYGKVESFAGPHSYYRVQILVTPW